MTSDVDPQAPAMSEELTASLPNGVELCYQTFGSADDRPLLLVMGLGGPMTWWPVDLCRQLAAAGFFVIRYDNRDTGHSTRFDDEPVTRRDVVRAFLGRRVRVPYSLRDMADDGFHLLDHLGIGRAHVAGVSMGGMIAQTMAIEHPDRVLSLTSIMSSTGRRSSGYQHPILLPHLLRRRTANREVYVASSLHFGRLIGSPGYRDAEEVARLRAEQTWERGVNLAGVNRQTLAILTQRDRTAALGGLRMPVTVVHGLADKMVHISGGRATAKAIPGARLVLVPGMGHDLPVGLFDTFVEAISDSAGRVRG
jgi:pimeloyl-ACP methyl ester carboxylesterase